MPWPQNYTPLGGVGLSALVAALPVVTLLSLMAIWHVRAHFAALSALAAAAFLALIVYHMPFGLVLASAGYGAAFGLFPIGWIILNAIFIYSLSVETGGFAVLQRQVTALSGDRRLQALLIAFCGGAFLEGGAGFGAPIAITGALMIGLGFKPLEAAKLALIGNTAPVAYGSLGIPIVTLAKVTGLDLQALSSMVGRQLPFFSLIIPFWLVAAQVGWRGMIGVWPACLATGASFAVMQFLVSNFHGPWLVDLASSLTSIACLVAVLKIWRPADAALVSSEYDSPASDSAETSLPRRRLRANGEAQKCVPTSLGSCSSFLFSCGACRPCETHSTASLRRSSLSPLSTSASSECPLSWCVLSARRRSLRLTFSRPLAQPCFLRGL